MAEFEVQCNNCGKDLEADFYCLGSRSILSVDPCETCQEQSKDEGYEQGKEEQ